MSSASWWLLAILAMHGSARSSVAATESAPVLVASPEHGITLRIGDRTVMTSPPEGLWSVATGWTNQWPANWVHASISKVWSEGDWTCVSGRLELPEGRLELIDSYRAEGEVIRGLRRFTWTGKTELPHCTLSVRWVLPGAQEAKPLFPGILYYGNPSGARTGAGAVAVHRGVPGDRSIFEEHRFAAPFACVEWSEDNGFRSAALHTVPSRVADGHHEDQWWSLGVLATESGSELMALSGPCAANGQSSVVKALQQKFLPYPDAWLTLRPGAVVEKTFFLQPGPRVEQGSGFRAPLRTAMRLHPPYSLDGLPKLDRIVRDKWRFAASRFRDRDQDPGFEMYPDDIQGTHYVMGWCGQAEALGGALIRLNSRLRDEKAIPAAVRAMNLLASSPFNEGGFQLKYTAETRTWSEQDHVSQGQAMENFARAIAAARDHGGIDTRAWEDFLRKACTLHATRILREDWRPVSTAEAFYVSPLCHASKLFGDDLCRRAALKAAEHYAQRHLDMREPYWGGTLDARCEDKEGALAAFQAFLSVYELDHQPRHLQWAAHALDVALSYTVLWDIDLPAGRLRDHALKTRGWTIVSAQNQHLDVYAVLFTPEIWRMGDFLGRDDLKRLAAVMFRSCGQLIDARGSQGEQIQQTNFGQSGELTDVFRLRGGYSEHWTVFWMTAHFLNAAAQFEAMGVDLDRIETTFAPPRLPGARTLDRVELHLDKPVLRPMQLENDQATLRLFAVYSDGTTNDLPISQATIQARTREASGGVNVVELKGDRVIPREGGIATIDATVSLDGREFRASTEVVVAPWFRDYHQTLVMKLFLGMEGEPVERLAKEPMFQKHHDVLCTFEQALELIRRTDQLTRGIPKILYLVGWQKGGHDHGYPSWDEVNPRLQRAQDATALDSLRWLIREARAFHTTVSLHLNMVDAYEQSPLWAEYVEKDCLARDTEGRLLSPGIAMKGEPMHNVVYPREWAAGLAQRRIERLIERIPELREGHTIHVDVFIAQREDGSPISPWHAKPENGGLTPDKYVETQRAIFHYWRERGFDVTGEGIFWAHPRGEGFTGLQPMSWWYPADTAYQMRIPEILMARGRTHRDGDGDFRFGSSMHGEEIWQKDKDTMPGFLGMFCRTTLPWYYLSRLQRQRFENETLFYNEGVVARTESGHRIIRRGDYILRDNDDLFVPALWKSGVREIIAYSRNGYAAGRDWRLPPDWKDVSETDAYKLDPNGPRPRSRKIPVVNGQVTLTLSPDEAVSLVPAGEPIQ